MLFSPSPDRHTATAAIMRSRWASGKPLPGRAGRVPRSSTLPDAYPSSRISKICARPPLMPVIQTKK